MVDSADQARGQQRPYRSKKKKPYVENVYSIVCQLNQAEADLSPQVRCLPSTARGMSDRGRPEYVQSVSASRACLYLSLRASQEEIAKNHVSAVTESCPRRRAVVCGVSVHARPGTDNDDGCPWPDDCGARTDLLIRWSQRRSRRVSTATSPV